MDYIIYKITNKANGKIYIGKTKKYYGKTIFGSENRLKHHITSAFSKTKCDDCPRLYNAIRKYGKDNFSIKDIENTTADNVDEREIYYIQYFKSTDRNIGYNIALGGLGRKVVDVNEETRRKISEKQKKDGIMNIKEYKNEENILIGYIVARRQNGKYFSKYFTKTKFSVEENLNMAKKYLEDIKQNKDEGIKYNRKDDLPKNINYVYSKSEDKKIVGYSVNIMIDGKKIHKSFQAKDKNLDDLLNDAIAFKNNTIAK
jgi:group I intron endonuclease